jgi:hypothetical protein
MGYTKGGQSNSLKDFSVDIDGVKLTQSQIEGTVNSVVLMTSSLPPIKM